jgi:hypothetical protein
MKVFLLMLLILLTACKKSTPSKNYNESRELVPNPEGYQKDTFPSDTVNVTDKADTLHHKKEKTR